MVDPLSQELLARLTRVEGDLAQATVSVSATAPSDPETGDLWYDTDYLALRVYDGTEWRVAGDHVLIPVHNDTGSTINRTRAVYVSGSNGGGVATVALARADSASTMPAIGLADQDIAPGADGFVLASGMFEDVNTSSFSSGDALYVSPTTAGAFTTTRPTDPAHLVQKVALITHANTNGAGIVMGAGRANDVNNEITALTGVALGDEDLGTFTGTTIPDSQTIKGALQSLETAVESSTSSSDHGALTGLGDDDHPQYLLADGTRSVSGDLNLGGNALTNGTVSGSLLDSGAVTEDKLANQSINFDHFNQADEDELNGAFPVIDRRDQPDIAPNDYQAKAATFTFTNKHPTLGAWGSSLTMRGWTDGYYAWQLLGPASTTTAGGKDNLFFRSGVSSSWNAIRKIWDSGNDGAGSGLDADTVDGVEEAALLRADGSREITGTQLTQRLVPSAHNTHDLGENLTRYRNLYASGTVYATVVRVDYLRPTVNSTVVDIGAPSERFRNLYLSGSFNANLIRVDDLRPTSGSTVVDIGANSEKFRHLYLSGNITVGGNVDGRDIATDGTKLDGIQAAVTVGSTAPVSPSGGDLWYHTTDQEMYAYDSSRSKWLSVTTYEAHFGRDGTLTANHYMRGPGGFDYDTSVQNGHPMRYDTTVIAAWGSAASGGTSGWNHRIMRWDDSAGSNGVAASYAPSGTYTRWQKTDFNVDYDANDLLGLNMFDLGSATGVSNHTAVIAYKRRAS